MKDDWKGWKNGKYDNRYSGTRRARKNNGKAYGIGIGTVVIVGVIGFMFMSGVFEINQDNLQKSVDTISKEIPQIEEITTQIQEKSVDFLQKLEEDKMIDDEKYIQEIALAVHQLINEERTSRGLSSLSWNSSLGEASLNHSNDMAQRNYFEHDSPEGKDFSWRYSMVGFDCKILIPGNQYSMGAENIMNLEGHYGVDSIASETVEGWMYSAGHRENILTPYFQSQGIGVAMSGNEIYITQNFC